MCKNFNYEFYENDKNDTRANTLLPTVQLAKMICLTKLFFFAYNHTLNKSIKIQSTNIGFCCCCFLMMNSSFFYSGAIFSYHAHRTHTYITQYCARWRCLLFIVINLTPYYYTQNYKYKFTHKHFIIIICQDWRHKINSFRSLNCPLHIFVRRRTLHKM